MEREYNYLLHLLGAYLREEEPEALDGVDWQKLMHLAHIHSVIGILGYMSMKYPICLDEQVKPCLRRLCLNTIGLYTQRKALAQTMVQELDRAGIDYILMKGYVVRELYPVPELRTFNDIDIVIRPEDRKRSHELMLSRGYQVHTDWEPVFSYFKEQELYEIHTDIMEIDVSEKADYRGYFGNMWRYAQPIGEHSYCFTPEFHFLYLLTHIAKHIHGSGAGVRMYLDVAAFVRRYDAEADWVWIAEQLRELKLFQFAAVVLTAVEAWFGIASPMRHEKVSEVVMESFRDFTLEAGVFGHYNREDAMAGLKHTNQEESAPRLRQLLRRTFPAAKTIQTRYTYLQEKPWLLPVAWVHRLIKTRESLGKHAKEAQQIMHADSEEVRRMQKLMGDIGL